MSHVSASIRLRPVRFAFLVSPNDIGSLLKVFQVNTCLWGGKYNPIIPAFKRIPSWWCREQQTSDTAKSIQNGYVDFFEPDFIVDVSGGIGGTLGYDEDRLISLDDVLIRADDAQQRGVGLDVIDLYRSLFESEYQFARRSDHGIVMAKACSSTMRGFSACLFGDFPEDEPLSYYKKAFVEAFEPRQVELDANSLVEWYQLGGRSALSIGHADIMIDYNHDRYPSLFVLDTHKPADLIDYWNLRAISPSIVPVPLQWVREMSDFSRTFVTQNYRPLPGHPGRFMVHPQVKFGRSIPNSDIEEIFEDYFRVDVDGANAIQKYYPALWQPEATHVMHKSRPELSADSRTVDIDLDPSRKDYRIVTLQPKFASRFGNEFRWMNVISLQEWGKNDHLTTCLPTDCRRPAAIRIEAMSPSVRNTTEGFVVPCQYASIPHVLRMYDGNEAFREWLKQEGITAVPSEAGRATEQIIRRLGSLRGVSSVAHGDIITLLESISRRPHSRCVHYQEFRNRIHNAVKNDIWRGREFGSLVDNRAVELGLELRCSKCESWSWNPLDKLGYEVECGHCLQIFGFPLTDPGSSQNSRWSYRLKGPFALPDYARGGYAAALALRFFGITIDSYANNRFTWSAGQELAFGNGTNIEADFLMWYQQTGMSQNDKPTTTIFGEAKSFGKEAFEQRDIDRMKQISVRFPGSICVFATLKDAADLSDSERRRLRKFAAWGRQKNIGQHFTRAPVIVLTGTELFTAHRLDQTWREKGSRHAELASHIDHLSQLADSTQQLYLGMESYSEFLALKLDRQRNRSSS